MEVIADEHNLDAARAIIGFPEARHGVASARCRPQHPLKMKDLNSSALNT